MKKILAASVVALLATALAGCGQLQGLIGDDAPVRDETTSEITDGGDLDVFTLAVGDCFDDEGTGESISSVPVVPCADPHDNEVYYEFELPAGDFPGDAALTAAADETCTREFQAFVGIAYEESELYWFDLRPTQSGWEEIGDRVIQCAVYDASPVTGSLRGVQR